MVLDDLGFLFGTVVGIPCWYLGHQIQGAQGWHESQDVFLVWVLVVEELNLKTIDTGFVERIDQGVERILLDIDIMQNYLLHESV
jgi:hypothetical protein